ncbi:MAG: UDP-N-acetylmuramoyl-tripeptide--D-alanyl-D-alanine ligase [Anaerolineae bacterium]
MADLWDALIGERPASTESVPITNVVIDSRQCEPGSVFVALGGERVDGHQFIGDALARGAIAVIAEARARGQGLGGSLNLIDVAGLQPNPSPAPGPAVFIAPSSLGSLQKVAGYWRRRFPKLVAIGITGSVGKSSTKELTYTVLKQRYATLKSEGNFNNEIGLPLTLLKLNDRHERAILEMGMYALGEIRTLCDMARPRIGIVTVVGPVHLQRLGSIENIARAKSELVEALPDDGYAILNGDDSRVRAMQQKTRAKVFFYGLDSSNHIWASDIEGYGLEGTGFTLHYGHKALRVRIPLLGQHSVHNALAATAAGLVEDLSWEEILNGLQDTSAQLRLIAVPGKNGITILDDSYNASPHSVLAALNLIQDLGGRKIVILGDMLELGDYEREGHRLVGIRAADVADVVVAVGSLGHLIGAAAEEAGHPHTFFAQDNDEAVHIVEPLTRAGDIVLVKGSRGAHMEDIVATLAAEADEGREH